MPDKKEIQKKIQKARRKTVSGKTDTGAAIYVADEDDISKHLEIFNEAFAASREFVGSYLVYSTQRAFVFKELNSNKR